MRHRMEVTGREILISILILAVMVGLGVWLSQPVLSGATDKYLDRVGSVTVTDPEEFDYILRTDVGRFVAEGTLSVIDTVRLPELPRPYSYVHKVKEEYRLHTETYTDGEGKTRTRTYHSWDEVKYWDYKAERIRFLGKDFDRKGILRYHPDKDTTIKVDTKWYETETRYVYYTCPVSYKGIMTGIVTDKAYTDLSFNDGKTAAWYFENAERSLQQSFAIFWILWLLLTAGIIVGFYALENEWLY